MNNDTINRVVSQLFLEKSLSEFYSKDETCKGWETNVVTQPNIVKKIIENGAERISAGKGIGNSLADNDLAGKIDHTMLKPDATVEEIRELCEEARKYIFASVCVNPGFVPMCYDMLKDTKVKVCTVIGFPLGANSTKIKRAEAEEAIQNGAGEIDMVINVGRLKSGDYDFVFNDVQQVVLGARKYKNVIVKVILETCLLNDEEKIKACIICKKAGADFVKTSTGFSKGGATAGDIALMKYVVGSTVGVKASGGIRTKEDAETMIAMGADRIGASASVKIVLADSSGADNKGY